MKRIISALLLLVMSCGSALASHPLARPAEPLPGPLPSNLFFGPTTLLYSQSWQDGEAFSRGFLLKDLGWQVRPGLSFTARFGVSTRASGFRAEGDGADNLQFEIPYASLLWAPSESFQLQLIYSQGRSLRSPHRGDPFSAMGLGDFGLSGQDLLSR